MKGSCIGIEIGGSKLQLVRGDAEGRIQQRHRLPVDRQSGGIGIRRQIESVLKELIADAPPVAIGIGFGGPVDWRTGRIRVSHQIESWSGFELGAWLKGLSGASVRVDNDANVAALGEAQLGAGAGANPVFYVTLGSGVGGGLVVEGRIYHGASPGEAEIGHLRLDRSGTTVESRCSGWAVDARIRRLSSENPDGALARAVHAETGAEARHLRAALEGQDALAVSILDELSADLAFALSHATHLFHPETIVLGGGLSLMGEPLKEALERQLPRFLMEVFRPGPALRLSALGDDAVPVGALLLAAGAGKRTG
ncbi:MAG TPA: ROK family protein [Methylomirabilota bacterium]|nr:ROK family protein [Methylomirabilota bacterium]